MNFCSTSGAYFGRQGVCVTTSKFAHKFWSILNHIECYGLRAWILARTRTIHPHVWIEVVYLLLFPPQHHRCLRLAGIFHFHLCEYIHTHTSNICRTSKIGCMVSDCWLVGWLDWLNRSSISHNFISVYTFIQNTR